jgi:hypothetical protein
MSTTLFDQPTAEKPVSTENTLVEHKQPTPIEILQTAVERGLDASQLEKLMDLQERWEKSQAEKAYNAAMTACQEEMPPVVTDATNPDTHSRFARFETIQQVAKPIYNKHGFALSFGDGDTCPLEGWKRIVCDCRHDAGHCVRYHVDLPVDGIGAKGNPIGGMNRVQGCVSTNSYGERVLTCNIFNITITGKDKDGRGSERISEKHIVTLNEWLDQIPDGLPPFLKFMGVESLADIPMQEFGKAVAALKKKAESLR